jgi:hypothetical protein
MPYELNAPYLFSFTGGEGVRGPISGVLPTGGRKQLSDTHQSDE